MVKFYLLLNALLFSVLLNAQPVVTGLSPAANAHNAPLTTAIRINFSQPVEAASESSLRVHGSLSGRIRGSYSGGGTTALSFQPLAPFKAGELLTVTLTAGIRSTGGIAIAKPHVYTFRAKAAAAPVAFGTVQTMPARGIGTFGTEMEAADFDADGDVDLATAGFYQSEVTLYFNNGAGVYGSVKMLPVPFTMPALCAADFNTDGFMDIAASSAGNTSGDIGPYIFLNDGRGNFASSQQVLVRAAAHDIRAGDLNGDGAPDLAFVSANGDLLTIALNKGDGSFFAPVQWPVQFRAPKRISLADYDGDGDTDVAVSSNNEGIYSQLFLNDGRGGFANAKVINSIAGNIATGDLDRDGDLDVVTHDGINGSKALVRINQGNGDMASAKFVDIGRQPMFTELGDMDGDNDLDIVYARWSDYVSVMLNDGTDGLFYTPTPEIIVGNPLPGTLAQPKDLSIADLDGDLDLDIVSANAGNGTLSVLLNGGTQPVIWPLSLSYPAEGGSNTVSVSYPGNWTVSSSESWLAVTPGSSSGTATLSATAQANPLARERTATLTVTAGGATRSVPVTQAAAAPTLGALTPNAFAFPYYGGNAQVSIPSNAATTVTTDQDWLSVTPASGFGDRSVSVSAAENPAGYTRTGKVLVSTGSLNETITVTQAPQPPRVYAEMSAPIAQEGGSATLTIESNTDWEITNPGNWYSFSMLRGSGNATVTVTAPDNESVYAKRIELVITAREKGSSLAADSEPVVIYQYGVPLVFAVSPAENVFWGADAQAGSFSITTNANWSVTSDRSWLTVSPAAGTGNGTVTFSAPAYSGTTNRTTTVRVTLPGLGTFKSFSVTQVPSFLAPSAVAFAAQGESKTVQVSYPGNWSLSSTDPWLTISPASGSGPASVTLTAATNPDGTVRSGKVTARYTFAGGTPTQTLSVSQQGAILAVAPGAVELPAAGESTGVTVSSQVEVSSNVSWRVSNAPAWLTVNPQTGTGNATLTLTAGANPSVDARTDSLALTAGSLTGKVAVTQAGLPVELRLGSSEMHFTQPGGTQPLAVFCNTGWQIAGPLPGWLQASTTGGIGDASLTLSAGVNPTLQSRSYTLTLTARGETRTLTVSQEAAQPSLTISADTLLFVAAGESKSIAVTANVPWTISDLPSAETWYSITTSGADANGGEGSATLSITAQANPDTSSRTVSLTLSGGGLSRTLTLFQPGTPAYLTVPADTVELPAAGESRTLPIASNLSWQVSGAASWLSLAPLTGKGSQEIALSAPANEGSGPRNCTLTVTAGSLARMILVKQLAKTDSVPTWVPAPGLGPHLVLAPNPAHHLLRLTIGQQSGPLLPVQLYNSLGQSVAAYALPVVDGQMETVLQVAHLPRGLYVLQMHTATGLQRRKVLLQ